MPRGGSNLKWGSTIVLALAAFACADPPSTDEEIAAEIERQVLAARPDVDLDRYVRIYAHEPDANVRAMYIARPPKIMSRHGMPGTTRWVPLEKLPIIFDGGCGILYILFEKKTQRAHVECGAIA